MHHQIGGNTTSDRKEELKCFWLLSKIVQFFCPFWFLFSFRVCCVHGFWPYACGLDNSSANFLFNWRKYEEENLNEKNESQWNTFDSNKEISNYRGISTQFLTGQFDEFFTISRHHHHHHHVVNMANCWFGYIQWICNENSFCWWIFHVLFIKLNFLVRIRKFSQSEKKKLSLFSLWRFERNVMFAARPGL